MTSEIMAVLLASSMQNCVPVQDYKDAMLERGVELVYEERINNPSVPHDGVMYFHAAGETNVAVAPYAGDCVVHYVFPLSIDAIRVMNEVVK